MTKVKEQPAVTKPTPDPKPKLLQEARRILAEMDARQRELDAKIQERGEEIAMLNRDIATPPQSWTPELYAEVRQHQQGLLALSQRDHQEMETLPNKRRAQKQELERLRSSKTHWEDQRKALQTELTVTLPKREQELLSGLELLSRRRSQAERFLAGAEAELVALGE
ncbi:MAG: hypothetical protein MOB07_16315 [Acidobacteria bacterium]|nr:hypothetical protein [Acidobacteriota bacterium]